MGLQSSPRATSSAPKIIWHRDLLVTALLLSVANSASVIHLSTQQSHGALRNDACSSLHIAINSFHGYRQPRQVLLASLRNAGVPMHQVHVFLGGYGLQSPQGNTRRRSAHNPRPWLGEDGVHYYAITENSIDYTAIIYIVEHPEHFKGVKTWFYTHDTSEVGHTFWIVLAQWCHGLPSCAVPLFRQEPSFSTGMYDAGFLATYGTGIVKMKKPEQVSAMEWKERGILWEDILFRLCDKTDERELPLGLKDNCEDRPFSKRTCICSDFYFNKTTIQKYGRNAAPRYQFAFPCLDFVKYAANIGKGPLVLSE